MCVSEASCADSLLRKPCACGAHVKMSSGHADLAYLRNTSSSRFRSPTGYLSMMCLRKYWHRHGVDDYIPKSMMQVWRMCAPCLSVDAHRWPIGAVLGVAIIYKWSSESVCMSPCVCVCILCHLPSEPLFGQTFGTHPTQPKGHPKGTRT